MPDPDQLLARLGADPAWEVLRNRAKEKMDDQFVKLAKAMMRGVDLPATQVEYQRGFFAGMKFLLDCPTLEAKVLDRALRKESESDS